MKKVLFLTIIFSFLAVSAPESYSGTAKDIIKTSAILTGIIGVASIAALANPLNHTNAVYYGGTSRDYEDSYYRNSNWGYYKTAYEEVWISGYYQSIWVEPEFEWRRYRGRNIKIQIRDGYYKEIYIRGHYETVKKRYWVNDYGNNKTYKHKNYKHKTYKHKNYKNSDYNSYPSKKKFPKFYSKFQY